MPIQDVHTSDVDKKKENLEFSRKILKFLNILVDDNVNYKIFNKLPGFDYELVNLYPLYGINVKDTEILELLLSNELDENNSKLNFFIDQLKFFTNTVQRRMMNKTYEKMKEIISLDNLLKMINACKNRLYYRLVLVDYLELMFVDFKNTLENERNKYYHTKPTDMQYEEDLFYDNNTAKVFEFLKNDLQFIINYEHKNSELFVSYCVNGVFAIIFKLMNYFLIMPDIDLFKILPFSNDIEALYSSLFENKKIFDDILTKNSKIGAFIEEKKENIEVENCDAEFAKIGHNKKRVKVMMRYNCNSAKEMSQYFMNIHKDLLFKRKRIMIKEKPIDKKLENTFKKMNIFSDEEHKISAIIDLPSTIFKRDLKKKLFKNKIMIYLTSLYEGHKIELLTKRNKENIYFRLLRDDSNAEAKILVVNFCSFLHLFLQKFKYPENTNTFSEFVEVLCIILKFVDHPLFQDCFFIALKEGKEMDSLDNIWKDMKWSNSFVKFKVNTFDRYWKESYLRILFDLKFYQLITQNNGRKFQILIGEKKLPNDTIDRTQRYTTIFQKMCDNFEWNTNYVLYSVNDFPM